MWDTNFLSQGIPTNRYSPYAAVVIDPFDSRIPLGDRYSGMETNYIGDDNSGSDFLEFSHCFFEKFYIGFANNPSLVRQNGENIRFEQCRWQANYIAYSVGQNQARDDVLRDCSIYGSWIAFDACSIGKGRGQLPHVEGGEADWCRYLVRTDLGHGAGLYWAGVHCEVIGSLGIIASTGPATTSPMTFSGCWFDFSGPQTVPPCNGIVAAPVRFSGCNFVSAAHPVDLVIRRIYSGNLAHASFDECQALWTGELENENYTSRAIYLSDWAAATFEHCQVGAQICGNDWSTVRLGPYSPGERITPGGLVFEGTNTYRAYAWEGQVWPFVALDIVNIRETAENAVTLVARSVGDAGKTRPADILVCAGTRPNFASLDGVLNGAASAYAYYGQVSTVTGTSISVTNVVRHSGVGRLAVTWYPRFHPATTAYLPSGSTTLSNVTNLRYWQVGDRLYTLGDHGHAITHGTYVTATNMLDDTMSISSPIVDGNVTAEISDATLLKVN